MPRPRSTLPAPLRGPVFTTAEAAAAGVPPRRLRGRDVLSLGSGLHVAHGRAVTEPALARALMRERPDAVLSHLSAARHWQLPLPLLLDASGPGRPVLRDVDGRPAWDADPRHGSTWRPGIPIDLTLAPGSTRIRRPSVRSHRSVLAEGETELRDGLALTSRPRTWLDLASELDDDWLVVIADHLLRVPRPRFEGRSRPWATAASLGALLERHGGRRGVGRARAALTRARVGADSPRETSLRLALIGAGLPEPALNRPLPVPGGTRALVPDLHWERFRVAAEYDGRSHRTAAQVDRDIDRAEAYLRLGWIEVRLTSRDTGDGWGRAVERVGVALRSRGWRGPGH